MSLILNKKYKIYIYIKSFYYNYMVRGIKSLFIVLKKNKIEFKAKKILFLPSKIKKFSVVKSPFVSKLDMEQFEIKTHKVLIVCYLSDILLIKFLREKRLIKLKNVYYKLTFFYKSLFFTFID
jgi:ribosomal protein S10